ncbi:MAG: ABC transporter ATP-binding protein [Oscillospiraceae bacterium]|jgi:putative ABC transport system ATP-binding protein|nr:ABC transporter ATP-binding protein [Oscillospiraceae bacterium]
MNTVIRTQGLCKSFILGKTGLHVLKNLDIAIYEGDFTVIMGSSGSGKSTLLYALSSMDGATSGRVEVLGRDITAMNPKALESLRKRDVAFVFQSVNLLSDLTAFENIAYCGYNGGEPKKAVNARTRELLERFGLWDDAGKYPGEMSGGQQQRVAIARALINSAKIIFADEPTGALNSAMGEQILDTLTGLNNAGQSIVMVTHDMKAACRANRLLYLKDGRIVGDLALGRYEKNDIEREEKIFAYLKENQW